MKTNSAKANLLIGAMLIAGLAVCIQSGRQWHCEDAARFFCYFVLALLSSGMKVRLPGIDGTMSVVFLFTLIGVEELSLGETQAMIAAATLMQCCWHAKKRPLPVQVVFSVSSVAIAVFAGYSVYQFPILARWQVATSLRLILACAVYFIFNTLPVASVIAFTERKALKNIWYRSYFWSFPYYLVGAGTALIIYWVNQLFGWQMTILALPFVYLIFHSYRLYVGKLNDETRHAQEQKKHAEDMAALHLRTIEALALAIAAKDHTTHGHLRRVQVYALEIGKELRLSRPELDALRAAALLHDIGKLAVPEHIISKPGKLSPEEFEKMKIHPVVGAEILEQVKFPYPVVPIVSAHHEKWNGKGYPYGLKGEEIPIGARILSAVDCLDAIASDRQYRRGLPLDEAMQVVASEAGQSYDPKVVEILQLRYRELEAMARNLPVGAMPLSTNLKIEKGRAPAAGFESSEGVSMGIAGKRAPMSEAQSIAAARDEMRGLIEISQELGQSLSLNETLSIVAVKLKKMVPHDAIAIYLAEGGKLIPEYASGDDFRLFSSLEIPFGRGVSGWVAENRRGIVNGNPAVESDYLNDPEKMSRLKSAIAVPLEGLNTLRGVLTLYRQERDAYTEDHLRILKVLGSKVALAIENSLNVQPKVVEKADLLTGLPDARSLFMHLEKELEKCRVTGGSLAVLVCDVEGLKQVRDVYGPGEADRVLQAVARGIKAACRDSDYVARMGGSELVMVLPGFLPAGLGDKIEQLTRIASTIGRHVCGEEIVELSVGAAFSTDGDPSAEEMLAEADRRVYTVRQEHRTQYMRRQTQLLDHAQPTTVQ